MFRPWLRSARPDDWAGKTVEAAATLALVIVILAALLANLPDRWVALAGGYEEPVRLASLLVVLYLWGWARALAIAALPRAPILFFGRLSFRSRGRRYRVRARDVAAIAVEARDPDDQEVFVVELRDGSLHDLCPVRWRGAGRLYRRLARYVG
ncbi:MAG: hypothetical protein R3B09_32945 [Nannocystaceae bacterium]